MDQATTLGLCEKWWIVRRSEKPVSTALSRAQANHWTAMVKAALEANKAAGIEPEGWETLAIQLNRHPSNLWRSRGGAHALSVLDMMSIAELVRVPVCTLYCPMDVLIHEATRALCPKQFSAEQTRLYAQYRLAGAPSIPHLDETALKHAISAGNGSCSFDEANRTVLGVARAIGTVLLKGRKGAHD
ncbi:MAG: hypothetical protein HY000_39930 [Planctomycetes bacterium]|nr:hypothetical protein [Planctomycetota bacterium]